LSLLILLTSLAGCSGNKDRPYQSFRFADSEPEYIDPNMCTEAAGLRVLLNLFEGLTAPPPDDGPPRPGMATHWDQDDTGTVWTFHLRQDAKWSDGVPLTAHDFVYSWRRAVDPATGSKVSQYMWYVRNGRAITSGRLDPSQLGVTALDDHTLMVELEEPTAYVLELLAFSGFAPVPKHLVEEAGTDWVRPATIVTNGPYVLDEWVPLDHITLLKNPLYHDADQVRLEQIDVYISDDSATRYKMYVAGEVDWVYHLPSAYIPHLKRKRDDFHISDYLSTYYYMCNLERAPFDDPNVRKALNLAIDKDSLVRYVVKGDQRPATSLVPRMPGYTAPVGPEYDPEQARRMLADAGYPNGVGFPEIEISFNTMDNHKLLAQAIQEMWKRELNIEVSLQNMEWKVFLKKQQVGDYDVSRSGWIGDYNDPMTFLEIWVCDASNNHTGYCNPDYDAMLNQARGELDHRQRMAYLHEAEEVLLKDMPILPIYFYTQPYLLSEDIRGFEENLRDLHPLRYVYRDE
jgi:ABC-type oligopeptide transport system substrate-binding subunit